MAERARRKSSTLASARVRFPVASQDCAHANVEPVGDGSFGRCTRCGDDSFPLTPKAAGACAACGSYAPDHECHPKPAFGEVELRAVDTLLDALEARGIVFARSHGGDGGLERVNMPRARLVALALGREPTPPDPPCRLAISETLLGESDGYFYVGFWTGHVESRARPGRGTNTTAFGDRGYWRAALLRPSFVAGLRLTDDGKTW